MLAPDQLSSFNTVVLGVPDTWGRFVGKRFESDFFSSSVQAKGSTIGAYMAGCDLENNPIDGIVDPTGPDYKVVPDMTTLRRFAWLDDTCGVIGDVFDASGAPVNVFPRAILKNVLEKAKEHGFGGAKAASELEFLTVEETMPTLVRNGFTSITPTGGHETAEYNHLYELRERSVIFPLVEKVKECGIVPEGFLGEAGPNQHELNIHYDDALKMADDTMIFKHCIKQHAQSVGRSATFMPKYEENGIGNSCHIHFNMTDESGSNAFTGDETLQGTRTCSRRMKNFLGGWHKYMRELFVLIAPTINSYRRHQDGSWAPNTTTWGIENRTTGFRVVGNGKGIHLENRLPGGDANVYLSIAALIVAGLAGVDEDLDCGEPYKGNAYECKTTEYGIPHSLREAVELFRGSAIARKFLGDAVVDHYVAVYTAEADAYERHVSSWEVAYYFDQI